MKCEVRISGKTRRVDIDRDADRWKIFLDGTPVDTDAVEISPGTFSILLNGIAFEVRVTPEPDGTLIVQAGHDEWRAEVIDPRAWQGRHHGGVDTEGRQEILAPMPGKVIRVLVQEGGQVEAGQGLLVVEAMKMQNEIRSPKNGVVERLHAKEGQTVNAGQVLAWID
jgi:biotin carboxyl carrier protein